MRRTGLIAIAGLAGCGTLPGDIEHSNQFPLPVDILRPGLAY